MTRRFGNGELPYSQFTHEENHEENVNPYKIPLESSRNDLSTPLNQTLTYLVLMACWPTTVLS